jgi:predicted ferric reductase/Ca2+-binding EF-hand superfamily protein
MTSAVSESSLSPVDARLLATLEHAFDAHARGDASIDLAELQKALGLRSEYLARRVLIFFDTNGDGVVSKEEFLAGARTLLLGSDREKLWFAFRLYDHDGDGFLDRSEVMRMLSMTLAENEIVERAKQPVEQLARVFLKTADRNADGRISFDEFVSTAEKIPNLVRKMTRNEAIWLAPNEDLLVLIDETATGKANFSSAKWGRENALPWFFIALFALVNVALFVFSFLHVPPNGAPQNTFLRLGRAFARCADFDGALILVPMMRRLLTRLRATWVGLIFPVDDAIDFHKVVGHSLFAISLAHAASFTAAYAQGHPAIFGLVKTARGATGFALVGVFAVMWIFSLSFIRKSQRFELFYFTHLLYLAWFILAIAHAPSFAVWAGAPLLGFLVERVLRLTRRAPASAILSMEALRSGVTRLEIGRPPGMRFGAGDYCFLRIPAIATREWHPFTISSAPERDHLVFHVRSLGNWTTALRRQAETSPNAAGLVAYVDGPYGTPSARIFDSPVVILIGAGIGVTPFASVLESIALRGSQPSAAPTTLERLYFFWLNQDQYSFEWFGDLLMDLERKDTKGLLDLHLCMTGIRTGATALGLEIARELMKSSGRSDIITGLRTHTHFGPPDWQAMLQPIVQRHESRQIHVYFCGPLGLGRKLRPICEAMGMVFREEKF